MTERIPDKLIRDTVSVSSTYIPDTTLHHLNGEHVVSVRITPRGWIWLSPDEADAVADEIRKAAELARRYRESIDEED